MQNHQLNLLDFVINRFFMKKFKTSNIRNFVSSNYAKKNCFILNCRAFSLLVVEKCFQINFACKCLLVKVVLLLFFFLFLSSTIVLVNKDFEYTITCYS